MKNNKKKLVMGILGGIIVIGLIVFFFLGSNSSDNFIKLNYNEFKEKIDNNDSFVLCVSRTTCSHCNDYKPKLRKVANKYKINIYYTDIDKYTKTDLKKFNNLISFDGGTPVTIFIKNGEEKTTATRIEGDVSTDKIIDKLKKNGFID